MAREIRGFDLEENALPLTIGRKTWIGIFAALIVVVHLFVLRGTLHHSSDFTHLYTVARCWLKGLSPYNPSNMALISQEAHITTIEKSFYPPLVIPLYVAFGALPWEQAKLAYWVCNEIALFWLIYASLEMLRPYLKWPAPLIYVVFGAVSLPTVAGIVIANCPVLVIALLFASLKYARSSPVLAGLCYAAAWTKPQLAVPYGLLLLIARRKEALLSASLFALLLTAIGCSRAGGFHSVITWLQALGANNADINHPDGIYYQYLIGFYIIFYWLGMSEAVALKLGMVLSLLLLPLLWALTRDAKDGIKFRHLAVVGCGAVLFVYHRLYSALGVLFAVGYLLTLTTKANPLRRSAYVALAWAAILFFALPSQLVVGLRHWATVTARPWLLPLFMPIRTYAVIGMFLLVAYIAYQHSRRKEELPDAAVELPASAPEPEPVLQSPH
jgi:hypothetical protein